MNQKYTLWGILYFPWNNMEEDMMLMLGLSKVHVPMQNPVFEEDMFSVKPNGRFKRHYS